MSRDCVETLIDALDSSAELYPQRKLCFSGFRAGTQEISFYDIAEVSKRYACGLRRLGLKKGDLVSLLISTRPEFIFSFIGTIRAGGVPVPLPTYSGLQSLDGFTERLAHIIKHSGARYLVTEQRLFDWIQDCLKKEFFTDLCWLTPAEIDAQGDGWSLPALGSNDLCLVQYTSGSTAAPKGVALTHRNVVAGLAAIAHEIQITAEDVWCSWLPLYHDMGLIGMLCGMAYGASLYLDSQRSFIGNPGAWLREFSRCGGTLYAGPSFSFAHMLENIDEEQLAELDLSRWRIAFNGSEPIAPLVVEQFIQRFSKVNFRPQAMFPVYGMAEATLAVSFPELGSKPLIQWVDSKVLAEAGKVVKVARSNPLARGVLSVGKAVYGHTVRIVDSLKAELPENYVGEVQVKGPAVMVGYYGDSERSTAALREGWLCTGDLGYISNGLLFITGRVKEMVIVNGRNFYPQDIEQLVSSIDGVYKGHCLALGHTDSSTEEMIVAVETNICNEVERSVLANKLCSLISNHLGLFAVRICLLKPGGIPRTSSGKYQRLLLRDNLRLGKLQEQLWPKADLYSNLQPSRAS
jgi:acyl-CoA synthetase (AMP-forming)/AMP-acid ligase II